MTWKYITSTGHHDYMEQLDVFLRIGHSLRPEYTVVGSGILSNINGTATSVHETITVTFTSGSAFTVSGSVSGSLGSGTAGTNFVSSVVAFDSSATGWASGDTVVFVMTKPWETVFKYMNRRDGTAISDMANPEYAFNHNSGDSATKGTLPSYIGTKFKTPVSLRKFAIRTTAGTSSIPKDFQLQWSDNGTTWTAHQTYTNQVIAASSLAAYDLSPATDAHLYWRLYITAVGSGTSSAVADLYFIESDLPSDREYIYDISFRTNAEIVWKAPGDDGNSNIFVGFKEYYDITNDMYGWRTYGAANYDPLLSNGNPASQLRAFYGDGMSLQNIPTINGWFVATGSYLAICGKISTVYSPCYMGLLNLYSNAERFTYPLALAACALENLLPLRWSEASAKHQGFWCGEQYQSSQYVGVKLLMNDGTTIKFYGNGYSTNHVHPGRFLFDLNKNSNGTVPMFPVILHTNSVGSFTAGQLQGMQQISGDGVISGDTIDQGRIKYIVFQGTYETSKTSYIAFELV